ncbi:hypothetical protein Tco_1220890 [Tanacetum coccineum]
MADVNALIEQAPAVDPPTRTDEQILPRIRWVPIGKINCYLDAKKSQSNLIYKIAVDILKHTNFFRAFTASSTIPAIYIQQFWDTICYDRIDGGYKCQLDEQWFNLTKNTLRDALQITPVNNNKAFSSPPTQDTLINFTSGFERPRAPVLQILWGVINRAHIDYAERMWEEFTQSIHTFTEDKKNLAQHTQGKKKATLIVIPSVRFTKLIIFHLQCKHKFHPRPESPLYLPIEEPILGITTDAYLKKVAKHQRYLAGHVKDSELASLFGKLKYEENLIDSIYETEKNKSLISATPLSTAFFYTSIVQEFQNNPDDEEDTRRSHEYLNDLEEEYQARDLLAKSKRFFKKGTQRFRSAKATDQTECHKCRKKGLHKDGDADASFYFRNSDKYYHDPEECEYAGPKVTTSHEGNIPQQG